MAGWAFVFPGQGSQAVGMGLAWGDDPLVEDTFAEADQVLGIPLRGLCAEGPAEALARTEIAQPALFTCGYLAHRLLTRAGWRPVAVAGHSLGEYTALAAAGALSFPDGLRAVRRRGELMAAVGDRIPGGMAAILGLGPEQVLEVCREASALGCVEPANDNSPDQTVISGELAALERAMELAKERGARRAIRLNLAAPFHSSLMEPVAAEMRAFLDGIEVRRPQVPVLANVTAAPVREPDEIRGALIRQLSGRVRWRETILALAGMSVQGTVEAGPGRVLTGLTPRNVPGLSALDTAEALRQGPPPE